jgi:alpha-tubulin suppressor-like RCC1 family protein
MEPVHVQFSVNKRKRGDNTDDDEVYLEPFVEEREERKLDNQEYISQGISFNWGLDHGIFIDNKYRLFSSGFNRYGRLGHGDEKDISKFTQIKAFKNKKIIDA